MSVAVNTSPAPSLAYCEEHRPMGSPELVNQLRAERDRLRGYAQHKDDCRIFWPLAGVAPTCDCGLEALLGQVWPNG